MAMNRQKKEKLMRNLFFLIASASIAILMAITVFLFAEGVPIFNEVAVKDFIFGKYWYPTSDPPEFGIFPLIIASIAVTGVAAAIAIPLGVMTDRKSVV